MKKYSRAIRLYRQVAGQFPESDYAPRSRLQIGHCLVGMGRPGDAVSHWNGFVTEDKSGKRRGQAYVSLIDLLLEERLDLEGAAKYAEKARGAIAPALEDEESASSWEKAARALWLRIGLVSLCRGQDSVASEAFGKTKDRTKSRFKRECLTRLIRLSKAGEPLIPGAAGSRTEKSASGTLEGPALALTVAMVHTLAGSYGEAVKFFERVSGREATEDRRGRGAMRGASAAQRAFAEFGRGNLLEIHNKPEQALEHYRTSLKMYPPEKSPTGTTKQKATGTSGMNGRTDEGCPWHWHDETLYRVGLLVEQLAEAKNEKSQKIEKIEKGEKRNSGGPHQLQEERRRRMERRHRLAEAKAEALPVWHRLIETYPESPRAEVARYHRATLRHGLAETVVGGAPQKVWRSVAGSLKNFCEQHPASWRTGDAAVRWMQTAQERLFDQEMAIAAARQAARWAERTKNNKNNEDRSDIFPAWYKLTDPPAYRELKKVMSECYYRAAVIAYLCGETERAAEWIEAAGPKAPSRRLDSNPDMQAIALHYLREQIRSEKPLIPENVLKQARTGQQRMILQLGELYKKTLRPRQAEQLFGRIARGGAGMGQVPAGLQAYALLHMATALDRQPGRRSEALTRLRQLVAREDLKGTNWHGEAMFRLALFTYNQTQKPSQSLPLYREMLRQYPNHGRAEKAHLYYCLDVIALEKGNLAKKAARVFLKKYPDSKFRKLVQKRLDSLKE